VSWEITVLVQDRNTLASDECEIHSTNNTHVLAGNTSALDNDIHALNKHMFTPVERDNQLTLHTHALAENELYRTLFTGSLAKHTPAPDEHKIHLTHYTHALAVNEL
jgi:hypothetical protein